ncbi:hypothetical protein [Leekyejoonella antrihumi]|uniref:Recombinase A n=1 Tax=Leekyejoonella antrihumi TaxID=1660198 RepID=A0A563E1Q5_9MICO|nr:hypothetical protein [Leekyejoonella antrihumi]TWP36229.1 hypothetical protein FGL98_11070 [Leekyejoonella antrihumi]
MLHPASATVADLHDLIERRDTSPSTVRLPVHPALADAFPTGLAAGTVYSLTGSTTLALALLAGPSQNGSWCAIVGLPDLGVEAAAGWGVDLDRLILVPDPDANQWVGAVAALAEITDVIVAAPSRITPGDLSRLAARLRSRQTTLVVTGPWPRAATVQATTVGWDGLGQGHGCLLRQHLRLDITERHEPRSIHLTLNPHQATPQSSPLAGSLQYFAGTPTVLPRPSSNTSRGPQ